MSDKRRLSLSNCRTSRSRVEPRALRIASSFRRDSTRISSGHVQAGDEQNDHARPINRQQRLPHDLRLPFLEGGQLHAPSAIGIWIFALQFRGHSIQVLLRLLHGNAGLEPCDDVVELQIARKDGAPHVRRKKHLFERS